MLTRAAQALEVFAMLPGLAVEANNITFNALIEACARGDQWGQALTVYEEMRRQGAAHAPDQCSTHPPVHHSPASAPLRASAPL